MFNLNKLPKNVQDNIAYILICFSIFSLLFFGFILPKTKIIKQDKAILLVKKKDIVEIDRLLAEYKSIPSELDSLNKGKSLLAKVDSISNELSLKKKMGHIKSVSAKKNKEGADVKFDNLNFKEVTDLILILKRDKIKIVRLRLKDNDLDGLWNLSLVLEG